MTVRERMNRMAALLTAAFVLAISMTWVTAQQPAGAAGQVALDPDDIGGVVTSAKGPEAGVWVIAETKDLPTRLIKTVVTDDRGRYVLPDLPSANYQVFVRGYGLVDSARVQAKPGTHLDLKAVVAPDGKAAAQVLPGRVLALAARDPEGAEVGAGSGFGGQVLPAVPSAGHQVDAGAPDDAGNLLVEPRSLGFARQDRLLRRHDEHVVPAARAAAEDVRGLVGSHRRGRVSAAGASAPVRRRAERRDHRVGLGVADRDSRRRRGDQRGEPPGQCKRPRVRRLHDRRQARLAGSQDAHRGHRERRGDGGRGARASAVSRWTSRAAPGSPPAFLAAFPHPRSASRPTTSTRITFRCPTPARNRS